MPLYGSYLKHEELKRKIILDPSLLGLENIATYKEEVTYTNGRRILGQVDLIMWDKYGQPYIVEMTTGDSDRARRRVKKQARRAKKFFQNAKAVSIIQKENRILLEWV